MSQADDKDSRHATTNASYLSSSIVTHSNKTIASHFSPPQVVIEHHSDGRRFDPAWSDQQRTHPSVWLRELKDQIAILFREHVPHLLSHHQALLDEQIVVPDTADGDFQELRDHQITFERSIAELANINPYTLDQARWLLNRLQREIERFRARLPIYTRREQLIRMIQSNRVVILKAETGSGKSSQVVQYLLDAGLADRDGSIVCSQPRRLAARELASRVAKEFGCRVGEEVGWHVGASRPRLSKRTTIRFVTHAVLLNEYQMDPLLRAYQIVIIDEAHERRIDTDLLFGVMKLCLQYRSDLKLIVMSATLDDQLLSQYYDHACIMEVPGRTFPIEDTYAMEDPENHVIAAIQKVLDIHTSQVPGDILVFLTGPDEIDRAIDEVSKQINPPQSALLLPLHGKLSEEETHAVFKRSNDDQRRRIIFCTNVAETSITIEGVRHVIDSGMVKEVMWDSQRQMQVLKIGYATQSSIKQRRGRAGRTSAGKCYHLYTYDTYQTLDVCSRAEILCTQPSIAVLKLKYLDLVEDVSTFDWLERPSIGNLERTIQTLTWLGALESKTGKLTEIGRRMAKWGLEPRLSMMIIAGQQLDCLSYVLAIAAMLSVVQNLWWHSKDDSLKRSHDEIRASFIRPDDIGGDYILLLRIFLEWQNASERRGNRKAWCVKHMIRWQAMDIAAQTIRDLAFQIDAKVQLYLSDLTPSLMERIVQCICAGFFQNLAISNGPLRAGYQLATSSTSTTARIHRSSVITGAVQPPKFILYHELLNINETNYLTTICPVELDWLNPAWLDSLPRPPSQYSLESYTFVHVGPALLRVLAGKKGYRIPSLEERLGVQLDLDYSQSQLTIWGRDDNLARAREHLEDLLQKERERLSHEVEEFEIVGSTRIVLGAGAEPRCVLIEDEYVKVLLTHLPSRWTEEQIRAKCESYGSVHQVNLVGRNTDYRSACVIYRDGKDAQRAVHQLMQNTWDGCKIDAKPSYTRTTVDVRKPKYTLKAQWFLTESEGTGRVTFSNIQSARQALRILIEQHRFRCQLELISANPTMKCSWPIKPHHGNALVHFSTVEQAQEAIERRILCPFRIQPSRNSNTTLYLSSVPHHLDEAGLKELFSTCTNVTLLRTRKNATIATPIGMDDYLREIFRPYQSFLSESIFVEPVLNEGCVVAYVQFIDEHEMREAYNDLDDKRMPLGYGRLKLQMQKQRSNQGTAPKKTIEKDEFRIKLYQLPAHVDEQFLIRVLNRKSIKDHLTHTIVFRQKLPNYNRTNLSRTIIEHNEIASLALQSLFSARKDFPWQMKIDIRAPTEDGRVIAYLQFDDPRAMISAIHLCNDLDEPTIERTGLSQLYFVPLMHHQIVLHEALAKAINEKIDRTIQIIQDHPDLSHVSIFKNTIAKDNQSKILLSIRTTDLEALYRARVHFDNLLQGLKFQLSDPSSSLILGNTMGQKFLAELQERTQTYVWWHWKSRFLRIFGDDRCCHDVYNEIERFIQERCAQRQRADSTALALGKIPRQSHVNQIKASKSVNKKDECPICADDLDAPYTLQQCGHTFCSACLSAYFDTYFDATISYEAFKVSCPFQQCRAVCLMRDLVAVLGFERMARLAKIAFQIYIRRPENNLAQCIGLDCKQVYRPATDSSMYFCDQCVKVYCTNCEVEYHPGMTCDQYKKLYEEKNEQAILNYNLGTLTFKPCPKCRTPIDKYAGCNAVKCTLCDIHFCWLCQATDASDIHGHFMDPNSPCYHKMLDGQAAADDFE